MRIRTLSPNLLSWTILSFLICMQWSCTFDTKEAEKSLTYNQIVGDWVITSAQKDGNSTGMLEGAYFKFLPNNKMATNITGSEIFYDIKLDKYVIQQKGNVEIFYNVESITDTTMLLTFNMRGFAFKLNLTKS